MIIAIANQKGGVLKTTTTYNLSKALADAGKKVLMCDLDSQASLTISTGNEPDEYKHTICDILKKKPEEITDCIYKISDNLNLIPSIIDLASLEMELMSRTARETVLVRELNKVRDQYDFILIDCPPQLSILTLNALAAADKVLIPCKTDYLSYRGLEQLEGTIEDVQELINPNISLMGVIATLYETVVKDHNEILNMLKEKYNVIGITKKTAAATKGIYDGIPVVQREPKSEIAREYRKIADYILKVRS
jgi:chromosome partitioning protein